MSRPKSTQFGKSNRIVYYIGTTLQPRNFAVLYIIKALKSRIQIINFI